MSDAEKVDRREFARRVTQAGAALAAGAAGIVGARHLSKPDEPAPGKRRLGDEFYYSVDQFRDVDAGLISHREVARIPTDLALVRDVAVGSDDTVWVCGGDRLRQFSASGAPQLDVALPATTRCLTIAHDQLYVGGGDRLARLNAVGEIQDQWTLPADGAVVVSLSATESELVIADAGNRCLWRSSTNGEDRGRFGDPDHFVVPSPFFPICRDSDGNIWVSNTGKHLVERYDPDGRLQAAWGQTSMAIDGFCGCCNPVDLAMLRDDRFVTAEKGLPRVKIYSPRGDFTSVVAGPRHFPENQAACDVASYSCYDGGLSLAVDSHERVIVLDHVTRDLRIFAAAT